MLRSKIAFHPWEYLKDELKFRKISQTNFANLIGKRVSELNELINGKRNITPNWALLLSVSLSTSLEVWLNLQKNYDVYLLEQTLKDKRKNIKINSIIKKAKIILC